VRFRVYIAIGGILLLLGAAATAPATTTTRSPTRVTFTIVGPRIAQPGELVRVAGRVIGSSPRCCSIVAGALFRVSESGSTISKKTIRIHESRFNTWTRLSKPGVYRVSVFYPGDSWRLPSSASVTIRVT
jgi:hypothetical protein